MEKSFFGRRWLLLLAEKPWQEFRGEEDVASRASRAAGIFFMVT